LIKIFDVLIRTNAKPIHFVITIFVGLKVFVFMTGINSYDLKGVEHLILEEYF